MSAELKPCPFCGVQMQIGAETIFGPRWIHPWDDCCPANTIRFHVTSVERIAAWNARASDATLASQVAEIERMREALKPFAEEARRYEPLEDDDTDPVFDSQFTYGELRRARAVLNGRTS